jgi:hypothetical protein
LFILTEHVIHDALTVRIAQVKDLEGDADVGRDKHRVIGIVDPGTSVVDHNGFIMPIPHEQTNDIMPRFFEEPRGYTGVDSP